MTEWKAVYGRVEARDTVPARARIGGIVVDLAVSEGDSVTEGQHLATVRDDKIAFQIAALDAQIRALQSQLATAETELTRGEALVERGVATAQRLDQLRTTVDVTRNQLAAAEAQRSVVVQQGAEGEVLAPGDGRVLTVPVTRGAVVLAGEPIATIGGGGFFLRLAIPERHAAALQEGRADPHHAERRGIRRAAGQDLSADRERPRHRRRRGRTASRRPSWTRACWSRCRSAQREALLVPRERRRDPLRHRLRHCREGGADDSARRRPRRGA